MAESLGAIEALKGLPEGQHWFCPRQSEEDGERYYEEDLKLKELAVETADAGHKRERALEASTKRKTIVLSAIQIFAFEGEEAQPYQKWVQGRLENLLRTCDICVREYHSARSELRESLETQYDAEEVAAFLDKFDGINIKRITQGLEHAERQLLHLPENERNISSLDPEGLFALLEVMACEPYLRNEPLMQKHFDPTFKLVQTKRPLKLPTYLPAFTYFLYSKDNEDRQNWAHRAWTRIDRPPTSKEFDHMVRKPLLLAMLRVQMSALEVQFLPTFWYGANVIVSKLTSELVQHSLRPLDPSIYRLALDQFHLQEIDPSTFTDLLLTWKNLIQKSPSAFWDSMRSIAPKTIIEQVFRSPALDMILTHPEEEGMPKLDELFQWILPFLESVKSNQVTACGSLVREFMARSQNTRFHPTSTAYCLTLAMHVLQQTLQKMGKAKEVDNFVGAAVAAEMIEQVSENLKLIVKPTKGVKNGSAPDDDTALALSVIENTIALDCLTIVMDRKAVQGQKDRDYTAPRRSDGFWNALIQAVGSEDQALATHILRGIRELPSLEKFPAKFKSRSIEDANGFAHAYEAKCAQVSNFLEKLSDFPPFQLAGFFKTPQTAEGIVHILFSSNVSMRQGAVELLKTMSKKADRQEAISHVLSHAFLSFLSAFNKSVEEISSKKIFTPMSTMLKVCADVVGALCNASSGILRTKSLLELELNVVKALWEKLWSMLIGIFECTEAWSFAGYDKGFMMDFCRDTMEFADHLFDTYSVFVNAIRDEYEDEKGNREEAKKLLRHPRDAMISMAKWLRLRDEYLAERIVTLITSLLSRLSKSKVDATEETLEYIERVSADQADKTNKINTNLNAKQKAQLLDAMEKYSDRRAARPVMEVRRQVSKQMSLNSWAVAGRTKDNSTNLSDDSDAAHRRLISDVTRNAERFKKMQAQQQKKIPVPVKKRNVLDPAAESEFVRKRKAAEEEAKRKRAEAVAAARGHLPSAGSGLNGLGVVAKDHSMKGQGVMVDSDEESSEESDGDAGDLDRELFGAPVKSTKPANSMPAANAAALLPKGPVKVRRIQRSAKDMRARLAPDLAKLHQEILNWDYFHDGYYPPNSREDMYRKVPDSIMDPGSYKNIFQPLLILEMWRKICSDKDQESHNKPYEVKVINRSSVDAFIEVNTSMMRPAGEQRLEVSEGDLVLFSNARDPRNSPESPSCLTRVHKINRKKQHIEILYRMIPGNKFMSFVNGGSTVRALKIESLVTVEREYGALMGLQYYDLCQYVLDATPSRLLKYGDQQLRPLMENYRLNQAQAKAVKSALDNDAFTLIQGPPGSGKTKTIVATVGALLTETLRDRGTAIQAPIVNGQRPTAGGTSKKILVCAPSNAAVDELVLRFKEGVKTRDGKEKKINVVRLGRSDKINEQVKEVTMDELIATRLNKAAGNSENQRATTQRLMQEHKEISQKLNDAHELREAAEGKPDAAKIQDEIDACRRRKKELSLLIDQAKDKESKENRQSDLERKRAEQSVLDEAHVLCATLSASGQEKFQNYNLEFETVIIDEAAQCTELQALIPLKYGCAKCILVGDPKQLPPTTFMDAKLNFQYEQSLFVRMQNRQPEDVHLLDTQYRMHPDISAFPSKAFYDSRLLDGPDMAKIREAPWHKELSLGPYRFYDVQGQQTSRGSSLTNMVEINAAIQLYEKLVGVCPHYDFRGKIGIITPYKAQFNALKDTFRANYGREIFDTIEFNTTDAFQGRECEIIIFSCVRASEGSIGFLNDYRRMNVGLTRAKYSLWVLGNTKSLVNGKYWRDMIDDARQRDRMSSAAEIASIKGRPKQAPVVSNGNHQSSTTTLAHSRNIDTKVAHGLSANSPASPRRSSVSSSSMHSKQKVHGAMDVPIKKEEKARQRVKVEDVEMKDLFSDDEEYEPVEIIKAEVKDEQKTIKRENVPPPVHNIRPQVENSDPTKPRAPQELPVKRRKAPPNPLMDPKRKKAKNG